MYAVSRIQYKYRTDIEAWCCKVTCFSQVPVTFRSCANDYCVILFYIVFLFDQLRLCSYTKFVDIVFWTLALQTCTVCFNDILVFPPGFILLVENRSEKWGKCRRCAPRSTCYSLLWSYSLGSYSIRFPWWVATLWSQRIPSAMPCHTSIMTTTPVTIHSRGRARRPSAD